MAIERMRRIGTGHCHRIPGTRPELSLVDELDPQNRRQHHVAAARTQFLRRVLTVRLGSGDENTHCAHARAKKPAPARPLSSRPASWPSADACAASPSRVVSYTWLPSGLAIRPRKLIRPAVTLA